jgi:hypothetical protein
LFSGLRIECDAVLADGAERVSIPRDLYSIHGDGILAAFPIDIDLRIAREPHYRSITVAMERYHILIVE